MLGTDCESKYCYGPSNLCSLPPPWERGHACSIGLDCHPKYADGTTGGYCFLGPTTSFQKTATCSSVSHGGAERSRRMSPTVAARSTLTSALHEPD